MKVIHGMRHTPTYKTWAEMVQRCNNPHKVQYPYYGGRGIRVAEKWLTFANFFADMGVRPDGCTLDRKDSNGNYTPDNCRWSTKIEQANNARSNRKLTVNGETLGLCEASRKYGVSFGTIWARLKNGWSEQDAATTPTRGHKTYERAQRV